MFITSGYVGVSIAQMQSVLTSPDIDCVDALNLDGGGSAQLYLSKDLPGAEKEAEEILLHGSDRVPVILGLVPR